MDKNIFKWNDIPVFWGFVVGDNFMNFCEYCNTWHFYGVNNDLRDGYRVARKSKCINKRSPFFNKIITIEKIHKVPSKASLYCPAEED